MSPAAWAIVVILAMVAVAAVLLRYAFPMFFRWVYVPQREKSSGWRMRAIHSPRTLLPGNKGQSEVELIDPSQPSTLAAHAETEVLGEFDGRTFHLLEERRVRTADANRPGKSTSMPSVYYDCTLTVTSSQGSGSQPNLSEYSRLLDFSLNLWEPPRAPEVASGVFGDGSLLCTTWSGRAYGGRLRRKLRKLTKAASQSGGKYTE